MRKNLSTVILAMFCLPMLAAPITKTPELMPPIQLADNNAAIAPLTPPAPSSADTVSVSSPDTSQLPGGFGTVLGDVGKFLTDAQPYTTNGNVRVGVGGIYSDKKWGGLATVIVPVNSNGQISIGFTGMYIDHQFYDASVNANLGTTWNVPLIGKVYEWVATGPGYNLKAKHAIAYNFTGFKKGWDFKGGFSLTIDAGAGNISDRKGLGYVAMAFLGWHPKGW